MATEKRLIDADALREYMFAEVDKYGEDYLFIDIAIDAIDNAPTVDAVEVVRCKDCKHSSGARVEPNTCVCFRHGIIMFADHFCSWGERREGE